MLLLGKVQYLASAIPLSGKGIPSFRSIYVIVRSKQDTYSVFGFILSQDLFNYSCNIKKYDSIIMIQWKNNEDISSQIIQRKEETNWASNYLSKDQ